MVSAIFKVLFILFRGFKIERLLKLLLFYIDYFSITIKISLKYFKNLKQDFSTTAPLISEGRSFFVRCLVSQASTHKKPVAIAIPVVATKMSPDKSWRGKLTPL